MTRRGYVAGALGAFVLVLVAVGVVPRVLARDDEAVEPFSADDYYRIDGEPTCATDVREAPALPLDAEPVSMLVCADPRSSQPWIAPTDVVEGDLSSLEKALAGLEPTPDEDYACTMQGGPAYDLVLRFSRGRVAKVHGDTGGCGVVTTAAGEWFGAGDVLDAALTLVEQQRAARRVPTALPAVPGCPDESRLGPAYSLTGDVTDLVVAVSCWHPDADEPPPFGEPVRVPTRLLRLLLRDVGATRAPTTHIGAYDCDGGPKALYYQTLVGRTPWGDLVALPGICHEFYVIPPRLHSGDKSVAWYPSSRSQRILDRLRR